MKRIILVLFIGINLIMAPLGYTQPKIPKKSISSDYPADVREQIERLYSSDPIVRGDAAYKLGEVGKRAAPAVPYLIGILVDDTPLEWKGEPTPPKSPGQKAVEALVKMGEPAIVPLIATLRDRDWVARERAVEVLGRIGDRRAVEPLIAALRDKDSVVRKRAAWALGRIGDQRAVDPLIAALKDENSEVREGAAEAVGKIGDRRAVDPLIAALKDKDSGVRWRAAEVLGKTGAHQAVDPLIAVLEDKDEYLSVLWETAWALGEIRDARAVEPLEELIEKNPYSFVSEAAKQALEKIRGKGKE